ncbi:MAG: M24 family metallopeptidase [Natronomonas sp.]|uniref:M24 family metallopeptidase n=1 Tax=Natronomonas sp. TaxID=2184060 RepID=UPI00287080CE|nr:M24 family metallopeptidase [Natronomonas sp.]MDR9429381.1 M24 family metallopeptidase [Natronomonas sp.]
MVDEHHLSRLDEFLEAHSLNEIWVAKTNAFSWLTRGSNVVDLGSEVGVAAAGYDGSNLEVVTANNERDRFRSEELPDGVFVHEFDWWKKSLPEAVAERSCSTAGADFKVPGFESVDISSLRQPLTATDIDLSKEVGRDAATAIESACRELTPDTTEREASALLYRRLVEFGFNVPCVLIGGADRAQRHRHVTPKSTPLGEYAIVTAGVERHGLFNSITRIVAFDPPTWLEERHEVASRVHATALAATRSTGRAGGTAGEVFEAIRMAYEELGYPNEWRNHHQGGAAGFAMREWVATPGSGETVTLPMTFAWNPTLPGAKSEETVLVTETDCDVLTRTDNWPKSTFEAVGYDIEVELNDIGYR